MIPEWDQAALDRMLAAAKAEGRREALEEVLEKCGALHYARSVRTWIRQALLDAPAREGEGTNA